MMKLLSSVIPPIAVALAAGCGVGAAPTATGPADPEPDAAPPDQGDDGGDEDVGDDEEDLFDTATEMYAAFTDCMRYNDWLSGDLDELPLQLVEPSGGSGRAPCWSCHEAPGPGAFLGLDPVRTFDEHREQPTLLRIALVLYDGGVPSEIIPNDRYVKKGREPTSHPDYDLDPRLVSGLNVFFERTYERFQTEQGNCVPEDL